MQTHKYNGRHVGVVKLEIGKIRAIYPRQTRIPNLGLEAKSAPIPWNGMDLTADQGFSSSPPLWPIVRILSSLLPLPYPCLNTIIQSTPQ